MEQNGELAVRAWAVWQHVGIVEVVVASQGVYGVKMGKESSRTRERTPFRTDAKSTSHDDGWRVGVCTSRSNFTRHAPLEPGIPATASLSTQAVRRRDGATTEERGVIGCAFQGRAKFENGRYPTGVQAASETRAQAVLCQIAELPSAFDERRTTLVRRAASPSSSPSTLDEPGVRGRNRTSTGSQLW
jgi:hypothetical protein